MKYSIAVIRGDGIGPEIVEEGIRALNAAARRFGFSLSFSEVLMGGCAMSQNPKRGVVDSAGRHHQMANLSVMDGSVFPTSIGANPQLSIYGLVAQNATALAKDLR